MQDMRTATDHVPSIHMIRKFAQTVFRLDRVEAQTMWVRRAITEKPGEVRGMNRGSHPA